MMILLNMGRYAKRLCGSCILLTLTALSCLNAANGAPVAANATVKPKQVVLLLQGMSSNITTWNKLASNNAGFDGHCPNVRDSGFAKAALKPNSEGIYCMRFNFGYYDRQSTAPKGLDNKTCSEVGGCSGDYSTFDSLGKEVGTAIKVIKTRLGAGTQIILLGHSRGGLVARAFLQSTNALKANVVGLITTGTPHTGSPLGRYYTYMAKTCLPESKYDGLFDTGDCADDWRFINSYPIKDLGGLDLKAPTIGFLSDASPLIKVLNDNVRALPQIKFTQLFYNNIKFGCLGSDPINEETGCGFDIFGIVPFTPSGNGLKAVLNGRTRASLNGDGIVPVNSQKMSLLKGWNRHYVSYAKTNRVHTVEPEQILDLTRALTSMYKQLSWIK